ncbi:CPCC family cysteine-rich protein [Paenisporosarcina indica]|uniref:CPCC family cysteine-rich protein n=1 Tax=Paenisporosarcina indica TaxID=650093 RepID=UPI000A461DB1|nr:CPCC family cysteine-rich protein [Paenisporosarcina indica]
MEKYTCDCCGYKTLNEKDSEEICEICFWHDCDIQFEDPDYWGGPNEPSLRDAQKNYFSFGAMEERFISKVRKPLKYEKRDENWKSLAD